MEHRRVVVTGLGLICGVGKTAPELWEGLMAGRSGMAEIKAFYLTGHPVRFAAEVKDFDPLLFVEKKESRKMGRFIHFALAASADAASAKWMKRPILRASFLSTKSRGSKSLTSAAKRTG